MCLLNYKGNFFPTWPISTGPTLWWVLLQYTMFLIKAIFCLAPVIKPFNLPDLRCKCQRWQSIGPRVGPAHIGQAENKKYPIYIYTIFVTETLLKSRSITCTIYWYGTSQNTKSVPEILSLCNKCQSFRNVSA